MLELGPQTSFFFFFLSLFSVNPLEMDFALSIGRKQSNYVLLIYNFQYF